MNINTLKKSFFALIFAALYNIPAGQNKTDVPFWNDNIMVEDPILFTTLNSKVPEGKLMTIPEKILKATNLDGTIVYQEGVDFELVPGTSTVRFLKDSKMPFFTEEDLYPSTKTARALDGKAGSEKFIYWCPKSHLAENQVRFTYTHKDKNLPYPRGLYGSLPKTFEKIKAKKNLTFAVFGDSISCGYNSSGFMKFAPYQPIHYERFASYLKQKTGKDVAWFSRAKGGMTSGWGVNNLEKLFADAPVPDFIFIAWGMNDITGKLPVETFIKYIRKQMELFKQRYPETEFILISTMYANKNWKLTNIPMFEVYRKELLKLADNNGIMVLDMTKMWEDLLTRKDYMSISGNGLNHPNDFGSRVYADVMTDAFERGVK